MKNRFSFQQLCVIGMASFVALWAVPASVAQSFNINAGGFSATNVCANTISPPPNCQVLTNGSPANPTVITGGVLQLVPADYNQHGVAWYATPQPLTTGFTTSFQFQINNLNQCQGCTFPADGIALVIQNDPAGTAAIGYDDNGQNLSYGNGDVILADAPGTAILNSLAVELDTYYNPDFGDPDANHIAVQSCTPNNATTLSGNSSDHNYMCPDGSSAKLALQSLGTSVSLADGAIHTITVNYTPQGSCTSNCNNFAVYLDSNLVLQITLNIAQQLYLMPNGSAYIGLTSATGGSVENSNIISWTFSQLPLSPIIINQPLQPTTTNFNYSQNLSSAVDYSQSGLPGSAFQGVIMQGSVQSISTQDFANLVQNTPFQGSTCLLQDTGNQNYSCVITTDLCTTPTNSIPSGANCPNTGTNALIGASNTFDLDPIQKPLVNPDYVMGKDTALSCAAGSDNTCKGLVSIFAGISGDALKVNGKTDGFNSILVPIEGAVEPSTAPSTAPALNNGWINRGVNVTFNSAEIVPANNTNPPSPLPTISGINYSVNGVNVPNPPSGVIPGATGSVAIPGTVEGATTITFFATDNAGNTETVVTNSGNQVTSAPPSLTIRVDLTPPTVNCIPNNVPSGWTGSDVTYNCNSSDSGSGLANSSQSNFVLSTNVPPNTQNANANITAVQVFDVAGNSTAVGPYGPFEVDKLAPGISLPQLLTNTPTQGQYDTATYTCSDIGGSGVVACGPAGSGSFLPVPSIQETTVLDTGTLGQHTFTVNSQDAVGNVSTPVMVNYVVGVASPTLTLTPSINPANINQTVAFTAAVAPQNGVEPTGTIMFFQGPNVIASAALHGGQAILNKAFGSPGTKPMSAAYSGDANYAPALSPVLNEGIGGAPSVSTAGSSQNPVPVGDAVTLTASVSSNFSGTPTGTMTFFKNGDNIGTVPLVNGQASLKYVFGSPGTKLITANYSGDSRFASSTTQTLIEIAATGMGVPSVTNLSANPNPSNTGQSVTFTAIVSSSQGSPTGSVSFKKNGQVFAIVPLVNGQASTSLGFGGSGLKSISAIYSGDATFGPSGVEITQTVQ